MNFWQSSVIAFFSCLLVLKSGFGAIKSGLDLYCDFDGQCPGWRNGTSGLEDSADWSITNKLVVDAWHSIPRPFQGERFGYVVGRGGPYPDTAWLMTDTVPCLLIKSYLTFYYWKNTFLSGLFRANNPLLRVYLRKQPWTERMELLADLSQNNRWGWRFAALEIPPVNTSFQIVIEAQCETTFDVVALDEIIFRGYVSGIKNLLYFSIGHQTIDNYCSLPEHERSLLIASGLIAPNTTNPLEPKPNYLGISSPLVEDNNLLFPEDYAEVDRPIPPFLQEPPKSVQRRTQPNIGHFQAQSRPRQPSSNVLFPSGPGGFQINEVQKPAPQSRPAPFQATIPDLINFFIPGQQSRQTLTEDTDYVLYPEEFPELLTTTTTSTTVTTTTTTKPPFVTENYGGPFRFKNQQGEFRNFLSRSSATSRPIRPVQAAVLNVCMPVNCGFEGDSCQYRGTDTDKGAWVIMLGRIGNPLTGITRAAYGSYYGVAYSRQDTSTQILRSQAFRTTQETFLTFWYYFANAQSGRFVVCDKHLENCQWEKSKNSVTVNSRRWRLASIPLAPGDHQILFVVENLHKHYYVGLDEIVLRLESATGPPAPCIPDN